MYVMTGDTAGRVRNGAMTLEHGGFLQLLSFEPPHFLETYLRDPLLLAIFHCIYSIQFL